MAENDKLGVAQKFDPAMRPGDVKETGTSWYSPARPPFCLAGFAWFPQDGIYRRMPLNPPKALPEAVVGLAGHTAGGQILFQTDSTRVLVRVCLAGRADMPHMPATGQCGFDCYVGPPGGKRLAGASKYWHNDTEYEVAVMDRPSREMRNVTLHFPLYQGVKEVLIGLDPDARIEGPPPFALADPVVVYGTSITQGGCACRPGMAHTNILSRRLNVEFVNLGFSGSGRGEPEVAEAVASVPRAAMFMLEYEQNCQPPETLRATLPAFLRILRRQWPQTPIVIVSGFRDADALLAEPDPVVAGEKRAFDPETVEELKGGRGGGIHLLHRGSIQGDDWAECTVDCVHPTDMGFVRMADGLEPVLRRLLLG
jgi:GDSL-like lipase/acylhydrolase family protein/SGNH-like hydrolase/esterase family protein